VIEWIGVPPRAARLRDVLTRAERDTLFRAALAEERMFVEASTEGGDDHRRAHVYYRAMDEARPVVERVRAAAPQVAAGLGLALPEVKRIEQQLTVHHEGGFYRPHRDNQGEEAARRVLTYVYFFHAPRRWTGGELVLYGASQDDAVRIEPEDNCAVLFDAGLLHEVRPLAADPPLAFAEGRFTINGWLWR
jgi:SM-20-related protein